MFPIADHRPEAYFAIDPAMVNSWMCTSPQNWQISDLRLAGDLTGCPLFRGSIQNSINFQVLSLA